MIYMAGFQRSSCGGQERLFGRSGTDEGLWRLGRIWRAKSGQHDTNGETGMNMSICEWGQIMVSNTCLCGLSYLKLICCYLKTFPVLASAETDGSATSWETSPENPERGLRKYSLGQSSRPSLHWLTQSYGRLGSQRNPPASQVPEGWG